MMHCTKCVAPIKDKDGEVIGWNRGRVFIDQVFSENNHVELFCIRCGKRWMIDKEKGRFGAWLTSMASATP